MVYLNTAILKQPVSEITFAIAREYACYLAAKDSTSPEEQQKQAKKLLVEWDFIMDLDRIRPPDPIEESDGYQIGLEWAKRQKLDDLLWNYKEYFDEWYGEYPYPTLTIVDPRYGAGGAGGMEYPTFITVGSFWKMPNGCKTIELTKIHEFGHQYFMGIIL